jgi:hypothetical protein
MRHCPLQVKPAAGLDIKTVPNARVARKAQREIAFLYIDIKILNFLVTLL